MSGRRFAKLVAGAVLVALVPACGGDDDDAEESSSTTAGEATEPTEGPSSTTAGETTDDTASSTTAGEMTETTEATETTTAPPTSAAEEPTGEPIDPSREIRIIQSGPPPSSWDPANNVSQITQLPKAYNSVYDTLLRVNGDNELEALLATEWEYDATNTVLTMTLRDDVDFTDGAHFDATVAKLNLERVQAGTAQTANLLRAISSIEAPSPTELVITQSAPNAKVLWALASPAASMASPLVIESNPESLAQNPVGSGPFVLESQTAAEAVLVRNDDYWDTETVFPARMTLIGAVDPNARANAILTGVVDVAYLSQDPPTPDILAQVDAEELQMVTVPAVPSMIGINTNVPPLDNEKVRQAINLALDREQINQVLNDGLCAPSSQLFLPDMPGYIEDLEYEYDVERARELMEEAGVGEVTIKYQAVAGAPTTGPDLFAAMLSEIGITLDISQVPIQEVFPNFNAGAYGMSALQLFLAMPDAAYVTDYLTGQSNPGMKPPELVTMVDEAVALATDDPGRDEAFQAVNQYAFDHALVVPLCFQTRTLVATPDVVGLDAIPMVAIGHTDTSRLGMRAGE